MKKIITLMLSVILSLSLVTGALAEESHSKGVDSKQVTNYDKLFKKYSKQLALKNGQTYKEVQVDDVILFVEIKSSSENNMKSFSTLASTQQTRTITSSQGVKNIFGWALYQLDFTTTWSYNFDTVVSSYSYVSVSNGLGWSFKTSSVNGPGILNYGKTHEWAGTADFAIVVAGIDVSNATLVNKHRVKYDGSYDWQYQ